MLYINRKKYLDLYFQSKFYIHLRQVYSIFNLSGIFPGQLSTLLLKCPSTALSKAKTKVTLKKQDNTL